VQSHDYAKATEIHDRLFHIIRILFAPPPLKYRARYKAAAFLQGKIPSARLRPPHAEITGGELEAIRMGLREAGLLEPVPSMA
jgi:dihydrodipicolinate synthase/N-acetylneuraminate lyase